MTHFRQNTDSRQRPAVLKDTLLFLCNRLAEHFGPLHWWPADSPFEVVIGAFLTQNTAWRNVELAIAALKKTIPLTPQALCALQRQDLEELIRPAGFFRQKAQRLQLFATCLLEKHQGDLDAMLSGPLSQVRQTLLTFKGIGPETADSILLYAGHRPSFVVDAYTRRLFKRYGVLEGDETYEDIRALFMAHLPRQVDLFNEYHALIVEQCKTFCRKRPLCENCPLQPECPVLL
ncbi:endonuclease III-related protein [Syntrophotalea carbinolica DSM 2380]|uniref:Endonuclease III-related protein n=1 Tax=Syntrophotalea carbinolica (strain DSM 2380 / NBRC 103641 / GraBd1) TaxID=338963 RepID=Q3A1E7_SYNC1|nr:endonuclease III domain-containing protein [Syntrophotalea carbinolica]ABA89810.1 endonuclease III-related protein [Syntrophotalea carbinolica DSM 2380]